MVYVCALVFLSIVYVFIYCHSVFICVDVSTRTLPIVNIFVYVCIVASNYEIAMLENVILYIFSAFVQKNKWNIIFVLFILIAYYENKLEQIFIVYVCQDQFTDDRKHFEL